MVLFLIRPCNASSLPFRYSNLTSKMLLAGVSNFLNIWVVTYSQITQKTSAEGMLLQQHCHLAQYNSHDTSQNSVSTALNTDTVTNIMPYLLGFAGMLILNSNPPHFFRVQSAGIYLLASAAKVWLWRGHWSHLCLPSSIGYYHSGETLIEYWESCHRKHIWTNTETQYKNCTALALNVWSLADEYM